MRTHRELTEDTVTSTRDSDKERKYKKDWWSKLGRIKKRNREVRREYGLV